MRFRSVLILPLCMILWGCGSSYCDEISLSTDGQEISESADGVGGADEIKEEPAESADNEAGNTDIYVYACGKVNDPGVYVVPSGSRIYQVLSLAGGVSGEADISAINQAEVCYDGEMIYVPEKGENPDRTGAAESAPEDDRVDINTADSSELQTLKGIGASRAEDIISYREKNGKFSDTESIMNVPGIKQGTFDKIKDKIKV